MSNTRSKSNPNAPLSQERYMSSAEFSELRGLSGTAVAAKAAIQQDAKDRSLLWFLQRMSTTRGGLEKLAVELIEMFPKRLGVRRFDDLDDEEIFRRMSRIEEGEPEPDRDLRECAREAAVHGNGESLGESFCVPSLAEFITRLCIDPKIAIDEDPVYFSDLRGALMQYKKSHEAEADAAFQQTEISRKVWQTLDFAMRARRMVVVEGFEGRGKTEAAKAWCNVHFGEARFVSLKGITNKTTAFREIAKALGVAATYKRKTTEMQARIEDVLQRSQIMLVIDEAHFLFSQSQRIYNRPELLDWIDTALCDQGVPVALVTTPQFLVCMSRAADQVGWNWKQFRRRVKRYVALAKSNTAEDLAAIARRLIPGATKETVKMVVAYALLSKRDASAIGDVAEEAGLLAEDDGSQTITFKHVEKAINEQLIPSDRAFAERLRIRKPGRAEIAAVPDCAPPINDGASTRSIEPVDHNFRRADLVRS